MMSTACLLLLSIAAPASAQLVINEIDYDQPGADTGEFIELKNAGPTSIALDTVTVALVNGGTSPPADYREVALTATATLAPGGYWVLCGDSAQVERCNQLVTPTQDWLQNGAPDAVVLRQGAAVLDAVSYEGTVPDPRIATADVTDSGDDNDTAALSLSRFPDGADAATVAVDVSRRCATPGRANTAATINCTGQGEPTGPDALFTSGFETGDTPRLPETLTSFAATRDRLYGEVDNTRQTTFYCGCDYDDDWAIDLASCGLTAFADNTRANRVEAEHVIGIV